MNSGLETGSSSAADRTSFAPETTSSNRNERERDRTKMLEIRRSPSIAPCREYAERLSKAGKSARMIEYPDAYHLFDVSAFRTAIKSE